MLVKSLSLWERQDVIPCARTENHDTRLPQDNLREKWLHRGTVSTHVCIPCHKHSCYSHVYAPSLSQKILTAREAAHTPLSRLS